MVLRLVVIAVVGGSSAGVSRADAPGEAAPTTDAGWSPVGVVAELGVITGLAVGGQLRAGSFGARISGGWNPVFVVVSNSSTLKVESFHAYSSLQLNADLLALPLAGAPGADLGVVGGYRYSTVLGHGVFLGLEGQLRRSARFGFHLQAGVIYFPSGADRVTRDKGLPANAEYNFPFGAGLQYGATLGVLVFP